jgi:inhibitor of cysteine peptidase
MDEHRDHLRVATTYGEMWSNPPTSVSGVYIFNANGEQTGEVTELAPGERIYSARFEGDKAYVVTFRQVRILGEPVCCKKLVQGSPSTMWTCCSC